MKLFLTLLMFILSATPAFAVDLDEKINAIISPMSDAVSNFVFYPISIGGQNVPIVIIWLLVGGVVFTVLTRGIAVWGFKHSIDLLTGKVKHKAGKNDGEGEVSSLQALATALSGTIGLGSIAGVAIAISIGGPGATFWICIGAILGMSLKFAEATMAVKYRRVNLDGSISGGPMHYIAYGLTRRGLRWLGQPLALIFAILLIPGALGGGNMLQINQATQQVINITGGENSFFFSHAWVFGLVVAITVALIIIGGIKSIARVTEKIVPFMCFLYIAIALWVIVTNFTQIPHVIATIIKEAFVPNSVAGGVIGTIIIGLRRSVQSNEAGTGSAPIAYATVKTKEPISQGFISLMEPFITACLCSLSAITIVITGKYLTAPEGVNGVEVVSSAFATVSSFAPYVLAVVIILFALSTIISWAYYGQKGWTYMFGEGRKRIMFYQIMFCVFIVIGSSMNLKSIIDFTDAGMLAMAVPNIIALYILSPVILADLKDYCKRFNVAQFGANKKSEEVNSLVSEDVEEVKA